MGPDGAETMWGWVKLDYGAYLSLSPETLHGCTFWGPMHLFNPEDKLLVIICNDSENNIMWQDTYRP